MNCFYKRAFLLLILLTLIAATACTAQNQQTQANHETISTPVPISTAPPTPLPPPSPAETYIRFIESYAPTLAFTNLSDQELAPYIEAFNGDYDLIGRTAGTNMTYLVATRRVDAPTLPLVYQPDIASVGFPLDNGEMWEGAQIGYYDEQSNPHKLYEIRNAFFKEFPTNERNLDCLCLIVTNDEAQILDDSNYSFIFTKNDRTYLDFLKEHPYFSHYNADATQIALTMQTKETMAFRSSPDEYYITLSDSDTQYLRPLMEVAKNTTKDHWQTTQGAKKYIENTVGAYKTGVSLSIDGENFVLYGREGVMGYFTYIKDNGEFTLIHNSEAYLWIHDKVRSLTGIDAASFDPECFETPLSSATLTFPNMVTEDGTYHYIEKTQTVTDASKLATLSKLLSKAVKKETGFSGCPYTAQLTLLRSDGEEMTIMIASDSCASMAIEGRIGFDYGSQQDMIDIFDQAIEQVP